MWRSLFRLIHGNDVSIMHEFCLTSCAISVLQVKGMPLFWLGAAQQHCTNAWQTDHIAPRSPFLLSDGEHPLSAIMSHHGLPRIKPLVSVIGRFSSKQQRQSCSCEQERGSSCLWIIPANWALNWHGNQTISEPVITWSQYDYGLSSHPFFCICQASKQAGSWQTNSLLAFVRYEMLCHAHQSWKRKWNVHSIG